MALLNRSSLSKVSRKVVEVEVPEVGETCRLREMSGTERDRFEAAAIKVDADGKRTIDSVYLRARLVASCWVDENNVRVYADDEIHQLSDDWPAGIISRLFEAAQKLNGLDAGAVADAAKN